MAAAPDPPSPLRLPTRWRYSRPLIAPRPALPEPAHAQKDPSVVFHDGRWHVFMTVRLARRTIIEHCAFADWADAHAAPRTRLELAPTPYFCAPQVFHFQPHGLWYLVYQVKAVHPGQTKMWVACSTSADIDDPASWTAARPILDGGPTDPRVTGGLDYWIICDAQRAYLFYTGPKGKLWRLWTPLASFPERFDHCTLALEGPFFEAAHIYRLGRAGPYLALIEEDGTRHYKAWRAEALDGAWTPLADTEARPFAGRANIEPAPGVEAWTDNVSHGELIRRGSDQTLTVDPSDLRFVFQGMWDAEKRGRDYGAFPWRIGMLTPAEA
jgi:hypothetical protein